MEKTIKQLPQLVALLSLFEVKKEVTAFIYMDGEKFVKIKTT